MINHTFRLDGEVRRSRARETRSTVILIDANFSDDFNVEEGGRWVTFCDKHGHFCQHETRALATSFMSVPTEWCEMCQEDS